MAVYTFSTKDKQRPLDTKLVDEIKEECEKTGTNFSALIVRLLRQYQEDKRNVVQ